MHSQQAPARDIKSRPGRVNPDEIDELLALGSKQLSTSVTAWLS